MTSKLSPVVGFVCKPITAPRGCLEPWHVLHPTVQLMIDRRYGQGRVVIGFADVWPPVGFQQVWLHRHQVRERGRKRNQMIPWDDGD